MDSLMDTTTGTYRVASMASTYIVDLDCAVIRRQPRTGDPRGSLLRRDEEPITLLEVLECTVGRPMALMIDLHVPRVPFTVRVSTPVVSIVPIGNIVPALHR